MRRWLEEKCGIHWHSSRDRLRHWFNIKRLGFYIELAAGRPPLEGMGFELALASGEEGTLRGHFRIPWLFGVFWGINHWPAQQWLHRHICPGGWRWGITLVEEFIWIKLFAKSDMECSSKQKPPRNITIHWKDWVWGKSRYARTDHEMGELPFRFPEGIYTAQVTMTEHREIWERTGTVRQWFSVNFEFRGGVPIPSKKWNDDAIFSMSLCTKDVREAHHTVTQRIMAERVKYGGRNWTAPAKEAK